MPNIRDLLPVKHHSLPAHQDFTPFMERLRAFRWPVGFKVIGVNTYDGKANSAQWLNLYEIAVKATGGDEDIMVNYLPVMLHQSANNWILSLWENSI